MLIDFLVRLKRRFFPCKHKRRTWPVQNYQTCLDCFASIPVLWDTKNTKETFYEE